MDVKIIRNEAEYEKAMQRLSDLMNKKRTREEDDLFELLILVIQDYEQKHAEPLDLDPIEGIKFRMEQMQMSKKDLVPYLGSISRVSEVLLRKRPLSLSMIQRLHEGLDIPLESLIQSRKPRRSKRKKKEQKQRPKVPKSRRKKKSFA